jgi:hypothetical protein
MRGEYVELLDDIPSDDFSVVRKAWNSHGSPQNNVVIVSTRLAGVLT